MAHIDEIISRVRATAERIKPATMAREAGLSVNALRGLHSDKWDPRAQTLRKLEVYLDGAAAQVQPAADRPRRAPAHHEGKAA